MEKVEESRDIPAERAAQAIAVYIFAVRDPAGAEKVVSNAYREMVAALEGLK